MSYKSVHTFEKGVDGDVHPSKQPKGTVRRAKNVEFLRQGDQLAIVNPKGTREAVVGDAGANINILCAVDCWGLIDDSCTGDFEKKRGIVYFEYDDTNKSRIRFFDEDAEVFYQLFPDPANNSLDELSFPSIGTVDARYYADRGRHFVYFTDHKNIFRVIEIKQGSAGCVTYPALKELSVRPLHPIDCLNTQVIPVDTGGSLLPGSYIAVYRYFNSVTCRYSGWSNPTNPIPVIPEEGSETDVLPGSTGQFGHTSNQWGGKIGQNTDKKLKLEITTTLGNSTYDSIQLLVIPMTDGAIPTTGLLTNPSKDFYNNPSDIEFDGNDFTKIDLSEYLVDDIPLVSAKTMEIKDGRVFLGNFQTRDFTFDNGDPTDITNASTITANVDYRNETHCNRLKGYFREENYVFGIFYYDEFGNGVVCPFDFTDFGINKLNVTGSFMNIVADLGDGLYEAEINTSQLANYGGSDYIELNGERATAIEFIVDVPTPGTTKVILRADTTMTVGSSGGVTFIGGPECSQSKNWTWKFPSRNQDGFSLFSSSSSNPRAIGLRIEGISNHPTWAKGFRIVRGKRKRDIIGQFLHVPSIAVNGNRTQGLVVESVEDVDYSGVQDTFLPKVHLLGTARNLERYEFDSPSDPTKQLSVIRWQRQNSVNDSNEIIPIMSAFVPEYMYNVNGESFDLRDSAGAKLMLADGVLLRYYEDKQELFGGRISQTVSRFSAFNKQQYFYNHEHRIVEGNNDVRYKKIEDTDGFLASLARNGVKIDWQQEMSYDSPFIVTPGYRPNHDRYEHIQSWGRLLELIDNQGSHSSVPGWTARVFYNLLDAQNQRQLILKSTLPIIDFTTTVWDRTINYQDEFFPLLTWTPDNDVIGDSFLQATIDTVPVEYGFEPAVVTDDYACAGYIFNIKKGLGDDRYGDIGDVNVDWVDTGVCVALTQNDISLSTPFDVDVWGGDCYITRHSFKVSENVPMPATYNPVDSEIDDTSLPSGSYMKTGKTSVGVEVVECWLESEVNSFHVWNDGKYPQRGLLSDVPPPANLDISVSPLRGKFEHYYNPGYSMEPQKQYAEKITFCDERTDFADGVLYSDIRVRGAISTPVNDTDGFDRFRANNVWILDSKYGDIIKLATLEDQALHVFQEDKIAYLPVGADQLQTLDGNIITTGSGTVIGSGDFYIPYDVGTQHMRSVGVYDGMFYAIDQIRGMSYRFGSRGSGFKAFSMDGFDKRFRDLMSQNNPERRLQLFVDSIRERLWICSNFGLGFVYVYNLRGGYWEGEYDMQLYSAVATNKKFIMRSGTGATHEMYDGNYSSLLGIDRVPYFEIVMNDYETVSKVLQHIEASASFSPVSIQVWTIDQNETNPDQDTGELIIRSIHNRRFIENRLLSTGPGGYSQKLRGCLFKIRVTLDTSPRRDKECIVSSITTQFRESK